MKIIRHRRNIIEELDNTPVKYGVEIDIRSNGEDLIIHHDPFKTGVLFKDWICKYRHQTLILNVKEEGLELSLISLMKKHNISEWFFLDQSFPSLVKWANSGLKNCAVRVSEFESVDTILSFSKKIDWTWVDCFSKFPLNVEDIGKLKQHFKVCLASPELQGHDPEKEIKSLIDLFKEQNINMDAVCTKRPDLWEIKS